MNNAWGKASLRPWHADYYVVKSPLSLEELREHIHASRNHADQLEWQLETRRGLRGLRFFVWRNDVSGDIPVQSVAKCIATEDDGGSSITVTVRVADLVLLLAIAWILGGIGLFVYELTFETGVNWIWFIPAGVLWIGIEYFGLRKIRRRDPPQVLASHIAASIYGSVKNTSKPPPELFRL